MGITIVQKSDPRGPQDESEDRTGARGRRGHRRGVQARRPEGARRLPRQPQDHRVRHLRRALRRRRAGGAAGRGDQSGGDDQEPGGQVDRDRRAFGLVDFYSPNVARVRRSGRCSMRWRWRTFLPGTLADMLQQHAEARRATCARRCATTSAGRRRRSCRSCWRRSPRRCGTGATSRRCSITCRAGSSTTRASSATSAATSSAPG